nr:hypothetical protein [Novosphingobium flavum]
MWSSALAAQDGAGSCRSPIAPTGALAAWAAPVPLTAAGDAGAAARVRLVPGRAARLALLPTPHVRFALRPEKPGGSVSRGGLANLTIREAGIYRVALGTAAWIDLVSAGKAVISTAHGMGPKCSGIRKIVDFPLEPGTYTLQIAASGEPQATVLVIPAR